MREKEGEGERRNPSSLLFFCHITYYHRCILLNFFFFTFFFHYFIFFYLIFFVKIVGIGETAEDRIKTLQDLTDMANKYGNIQEVILQPYSPGSKDKYGTYYICLYLYLKFMYVIISTKKLCLFVRVQTKRLKFDFFVICSIYILYS